ncbi:MAG: cation transporting ATPase C-terminal domain-containing protein [Pseudomonadota bacterium]
MTPNRLLACGFPFGLNMRMRLLLDLPKTSDNPSTIPLLRQMAQFGRWLTVAILGIAIGVLIIFQLGFTYLAPMRSLFGTTAIDFSIWLRILFVSSSVLFLVELEKYVVRHMNRNKQSRGMKFFSTNEIDQPHCH